ncbi:MAG: M1 family metallopeptidase [Bacteroidetes bacterium]|nr:M1 family metallopeptidase [Bacteroidota bacterium]
MKSTYLISLLLLHGIAYAQLPPVCKQHNSIADMERLAAEKSTSVINQSVASSNFNVYYYRCEWNIDPAKFYISGKVTSYFKITGETKKITMDLTKKLIVSNIKMRDQNLSFSQTSKDGLEINLPKKYKKNQRDSITIYYSGKPAGNGDSFSKTRHNNVDVIWTLSEPYGAKDWWPCRNGLDDKADSIDIYITHPSKYKASSNGILMSTTTVNGSTTSYYKHRYPIASYLVAIAVTNFSIFNDSVQLGNKMLPVITYVYPEDSAKFKSRTHFMLQAIPLFNDSYGEYPFINERYGQTEFSWGGGMEHQTNSFVVSTDENLMAHELAHQWFGDKITCGSWQDIWLNEGFATYSADFLYMKNFSPTYYPQYVSGDLSIIVSKPDGSVFVDDTSNFNRIFDNRLTYNKGAFLLRMLEWTMGSENFFKGLKQYYNDPKIVYGFARTADFQRNMEAVSGLDLDYFFDQWFYGQGYPSFQVYWSQNANNSVQIVVKQTTSHPSVDFFKLPLELVFKNGTQTKSVIVNINNKVQQATVNIGFQAKEVQIDPNLQVISKDNKAIKLDPNAETPPGME